MTIEADIEDYLVKAVIRARGVVRKVKWIGRRNAMDRLVLLPGLGLTFVELKKPGEEPNIGQRNEHKLFRGYGARVEVIDSFAGVDALIAESRA